MYSFCQSCGSPLSPEMKICSQCGTPVPDVSDTSGAVNQDPYPQKRKKMLRIVIPVAVLVVIIVCICVGFINNLVNSSTTGNTNHFTPMDTVDQIEEDYSLPVPSTSAIRKTIMIYMTGSNLASEPANRFTDESSAWRDIKEMFNSGVNTEINNILLATGGAKQWVGTDAIPADKNTIFHLDGEEFVPVQSFPAQSMGKARTLASLMEYAVENYPADEYGLILWDHGGGPLQGCEQDENFYDDMLELQELHYALKTVGFGDKLPRLEFIGFDACLMGAVELAWMVCDCADYMIASQEVEPGYGWDYSFLRQLNRYDTGDKIGKAIVDTYFLALKDTSLYNSPITMSCVDLRQMLSLERAFNELYQSVDSESIDLQFRDLSYARSQIMNIGKSSSADDFDLVDMGQLVDAMPSEFHSQVKAVKTELQKAVIYNLANFEGVSGLSVYHPFVNKRNMERWVKTYSGFDFADAYTIYLKAFAKKLLDPDSSMWRSIADLESKASQQNNARSFSVALNQEQKDAFSSASYYIIRHMDHSEMPKSIESDQVYNLMYFGTDAELSRDGTLSATFDGKSVYSFNANGDQAPFPISILRFVDETGAVQNTASGTFSSFSFAFADSLLSSEKTIIDSVTMHIGIENGKASILWADLGNSEDSMLPSRKTADYRDYKYISFFYMSKILTRDSNGSLLPYVKWDSSGLLTLLDYSVEEGFSLEQRDIDNNGEYFAMFVINDVYGEQYCTELIPLP